MADELRAALGIAMVIAGWAVVGYAGYLYYVALPGEHAGRHVTTRAALVVVGLALVLLGTRLFR